MTFPFQKDLAIYLYCRSGKLVSRCSWNGNSILDAELAENSFDFTKKQQYFQYGYHETVIMKQLSWNSYHKTVIIKRLL